MKCYTFKVLLVVCCLFTGLAARAQNTPGSLSPDSLFEKVFDMYGNTYSLDELRIDSVTKRSRGGMQLRTELLCTSSGYFDVWFETGSGFEGASAAAIARRNVICQLFQDISNFIVPADPTVRVNIWVRDISTIVSNPSTTGVLGLASSFYTVPAGAPAVSGIVDGEIWKTINSGEDSYTNVTAPLTTLGGNTLGFYHGMMAFNFVNPGINWHTNMGSATSAGLYDLYSVALHEVTHALGFASLINFDGSSKLGTNYDYYSRYDMFLQTQAGQNLITNIGSCSLYNFGFNPLLTPSSTLSPNPATCGFSIPFNGSLDNTSCATAINFAGSVNQAVYTPDCFEPPSSLSHLEDQCHLPSSYPNNSYYNMSNANGTGSAFMKRFPKPEERQVLCDIGYRVNTGYGNTLYTANNTTYTGGQCPGLWVAGVNDGIDAFGAYTIVTTTGVGVSFTGNDILTNDFNALTGGFECLEDVYGNGFPSVTNGNASTSITYTPNPGFFGTALLRYIPVSPGGTRGNITYIYIRVNSGNCVAEACNLINNGEFEDAVSNCAPWTSVYCWTRYSSSPDRFGRTCSGSHIIPTLTNYANPSSDTWNNGLNGNDHFLGLWGYYNGTNHDEEAVQAILSSPLTTGSSYTLSFWARVANGTSFANIPANIAICGSPALLAPTSHYDITNPALTQLVPSITIPNNGQWNYFSVTFTYTGTPNLNNLLIGYDATPTVLNSARFAFIDAVELRPANLSATFTPPTTTCVGAVITDLEQYANPPGGTFSGPGVTLVGSDYNFSQSTPGSYIVTYTYVNNLGCTLTVPVTIVVDNSAAPVITITPSPDDTTCVNSQVTLTATGADTYTWTPAVSCTPPCDVAVVNPAATTTYIVTGTASNGCTSTQSITITVNTPSICCKRATVVIPNGALSSTTVIPAGSVVDVLGNYIINTNVTYVNVYFRMLPGSKITVNNVNTLTLDRCYLFSCSSMWDGIYLIQSGTNAGNLSMVNCWMEDAINGVVANSNNTIYGSSIKISGTTMNKNFYSIQLSNYTGITSFPIDIRTSKFTCATSAQSFGNLLKSPYPTRRSYNAVHIFKVSNVQLGNTTSAAMVDSVINHDFGVYSTRANLNVYNFVFYKMAAPTMICAAPPAPCPPQPGAAIFVPDSVQSSKIINVGAALANYPNRFVDVRIGVEVHYNSVLNALNNTFWCTTTPTNWISGTLTSEYGIYAVNMLKGMNVRNNTMTNFANSIYLHRNSVSAQNYNPYVYVISNRINTSGSGYVSRAVNLSDIASNTVTAVMPIQIYDNSLSDIRNYGIYCVYIRNKPRIAGTTSLSQDIIMRYAVSGSYYGIYLMSCDSAVVNNNEIRSTNRSNANMHGIYSRTSINSRMQCNQIYTIGTAMTFVGNNLSPYISPSYRCGIVSNTFNNTQAGLNLLSNGVIGQQGDATHPSGNVWLGTAASYNLGQTRTDGTSLPTASRLYCRSLVLSQWPTNHVTVGGTAYANGVTVINATGHTPACPGVVGLPDDPVEIASADKSRERAVYSKTATAADIRVYPNPADNYVTIAWAEATGDIDVEVVDMLGRKWTTTSLANKGGIYQLNTTALPTGFYILNMLGSGKYLGSVHLQIAR